MADRRSAREGSRRPGQRPSVQTRRQGQRPRPSAAGGSSAPARRPSRPAAGATQPRFTGRAAVLVLVLAVLAVSYASSMRAYLQQRAQIAELNQQIADRQASIKALEREKRRWNDPAFVEAQARARFGYERPGETSFVVLDEDGKPLDGEVALPDPDSVVRTEPTAWWSTAWASMEYAGTPPAQRPQPPAKITAQDGP